MASHRTRGAKESAAVAVVSPEGKKSTYLSAVCRVLSAVGTAIVLVASAHILGGYVLFFLNDHPDISDGVTSVAFSSGLVALAVCGALLAGVGAAVDIVSAGAGARHEESRLRRRLLADAYEGEHLRSDSRSGTQPGDLVTLMTDDSERFTEFRIAYLGTTVAALIIPVLVLLYITVAISPFVGLILLVAYPLVPLLVGGFSSLFHKRSKDANKQRSILAGQYLDAIRNLSTIRLLGAGHRVEQDLKDQGERNRVAIMKLLAGNQIVIIVLDGAVGLLWICLGVLLAYNRLSSGAINISEAIAVVFLIVLLLEPIVQVAGFFYVGMGGLASAKKIKKYLGRARSHSAASSDVHGAADHDELVALPATFAVVTSPSGESSPRAEEIAVTNFSFSYDADTPVLHNLTLHVASGERVGIVGSSGGGKTTLLSLLSGDVRIPSSTPAGAVRIAGVDCAAVPPTVVHELTAVVAQRTWLFTGTIASNLRIAAPQASDDELWAALERANLANDVRNMPDGLGTDVGERGQFLSGGQAQRVSIARAFLSGRKVWLLDEPTAQVDTVSEELIIAALEQLPRDITLLISTHRPSLLALVDRVYELRDGSLSKVDAHEVMARVEEER